MAALSLSEKPSREVALRIRFGKAAKIETTAPATMLAVYAGLPAGRTGVAA
jgi:hypothetical protein